MVFSVVLASLPGTALPPQVPVVETGAFAVTTCTFEEAKAIGGATGVAPPTGGGASASVWGLVDGADSDWDSDGPNDGPSTAFVWFFGDVYLSNRATATGADAEATRNSHCEWPPLAMEMADYEVLPEFVRAAVAATGCSASASMIPYAISGEVVFDVEQREVWLQTAPGIGILMSGGLKTTAESLVANPVEAAVATGLELAAWGANGACAGSNSYGG